MKILSSPEKNKEGEMEINVSLTYPEIDWLKGSVIKYIQDNNLMDADDPEISIVRDGLKEGLHECRKRLKP